MRSLIPILAEVDGLFMTFTSLFSVLIIIPLGFNRCTLPGHWKQGKIVSTLPSVYRWHFLCVKFTFAHLPVSTGKWCPPTLSLASASWISDLGPYSSLLIYFLNLLYHLVLEFLFPSLSSFCQHLLKFFCKISMISAFSVALFPLFRFIISSCTAIKILTQHSSPIFVISSCVLNTMPCVLPVGLRVFHLQFVFIPQCSGQTFKVQREFL